MSQTKHPSILTGTHTPASLKSKIEANTWAADVFANIRDAVQPYVDRHAQDPEWIVSRLCMHWQTRYEHAFVNGPRWSHGEGLAPVPTVRFAGARDWATDYAPPAIEDILPYSEDPRGIWLQNKTREGTPWEWADVSVTGHIIEGINERIMGLAEKAAFLYWYTGDDAYAKFAADIMITYAHGMIHRHAPETFEDHSQAHILGLATFEVIHERITYPLAVTYDYLLPYLIQTGVDTLPIQNLFRRWADRIIEGGFAHGNWNLHQAKYIVPLGLALEPNSTYEDGKGREFYVDHFTTRSTENQACLSDLIDQYDEKGVWPESPGYAFNVTDNIIAISQLVFNGRGLDLVSEYPILEKAALLVFQYCFPNGRTVGFGDTSHGLPSAKTLELMIARAKRIGDSQTEQRLTGVLQGQIDEHGYVRGDNASLFELATYVDALSSTGNPLAGDPHVDTLSTRTFHAETVSLILQRNGSDAQTGLMASLTGTQGGHAHASGLALELYGRGLVVSPDSGPGVSYWQKEHGEYYRSPPGHNTVVVDGVSNYNPRDQRAPFTTNAAEPTPQNKSAISDDCSFFDVSLTEPSTEADQRRVVGLVRTGLDSGYYVDIFRSRRQDGSDKYHDHIHHNLGKTVELHDTDGNILSMSDTEALGTSSGDQAGYDYFTDKRQISLDGSFTAVFGIELPDGELETTVHMPAQRSRRVFAVRSPWARTTRSGSAPESLRGPMPTLLVRQEGEAWTDPFVAVIETTPSNAATIQSVTSRIQDEAVLVTITSTVSGRSVTHTVISDVQGSRKEIDGTAFACTYGCVTRAGNEILSIYLGNGKRLGAEGVEIEIVGEKGATELRILPDAVQVSSTAEVDVILPQALGLDIQTALTASGITNSESEAFRFRVPAGGGEWARSSPA